jgi:excisionase family DNA binding protein
MADTKQMLTTTQAARLLSVSPDTVLKWVKAGKIPAKRTLGGHYRIKPESLDLPPKTVELLPVVSSPTDIPVVHQYCWEFHADNGEIKDDCLSCITYKSRSRRCYEFADLPEGIGFLKLNCRTTCEECDFYRLVSGQNPNILICSKSQRIITDLRSADDCENMNIRIGEDEYEVASIIETFRPDFIVVDCSIGYRRSKRLCMNLFRDARIPVTRILLASRSKNLTDYCDRDVFAWIKKPFTTEQLKECIEGASRTRAH